MLSLTGPNVLYPNTTVRFALNGNMDDPVGLGTRLVSAALPGATVRLLGPYGVPAYANPNGGALDWWTNVSAPLMIEVAMGAQAPASESLTLNFTSILAGAVNGTVTQAISFPVTIVPAAACPINPVPNFATWQKLMTQLADQWAPGVPQGQLPPDDGYDLGRVYFQVGDYLRTNKYVATALSAAQQYRDIVKAAGGSVAGWDVYPKTLRMAYERTQDQSFADALVSLQNSAWVKLGGFPTPSVAGSSTTTFRETSLGMQVWMESARVGQALNPLVHVAATNLLSQINCTYVQEDRTAPNQPFWFGLAAEALIDYYGITGDARVVEAIRTACDYIWAHGVDPNTGMVLYNIWTPQGDGTNAPAYCGLNLMFVCAWGFLYKVLGDRRYLAQGDFLFEHFNDDPGGGITGSVKVFAQNYRTSIDYVTKYRS